uniref:Uncharacterized protein n=1 Tax=Pyrodinium bahamense TaxID=73915 RepID=A0A7S0FE79_9DINO
MSAALGRAAPQPASRNCRPKAGVPRAAPAKMLVAVRGTSRWRAASEKPPRDHPRSSGAGNSSQPRGASARPAKRARAGENSLEKAPAEAQEVAPAEGGQDDATPSAASRLRDAAAKAAQAAAWVVGAANEAAKAAEALAAATSEVMPLLAEKAQAEEATSVVEGLAVTLKGASATGMELTIQAQDAMVRAAQLDEQCSWQPLGHGGSAAQPPPNANAAADSPEEARRRWASAVLGLSPEAAGLPFVPGSRPPARGPGPEATGTPRPPARRSATTAAMRQRATALLGTARRPPPPSSAKARPVTAKKEQQSGGHDETNIDIAPKRHPLRVLSTMTGCKLAEWRSERSLAHAAQTGRRIRDTDVTFVLDAWKFRRNDRRKNVIPDGKGFVSSEMLGLVCVRAFHRLVIAQQSRKFPLVTKLLCQYLHDNPPPGLPRGSQFPFTTICINKDYAARRHRDNNNLGLSVVRALGNFKGGRLRYWPDDPGAREAPDVETLKESEAVVLDVRGRSVALDSTKAHEVEAFEGRRYSIVYFTVPRHERCAEEVRSLLSERCGLELKDDQSAEDIWRFVRQPSSADRVGKARSSAAPAQRANTAGETEKLGNGPDRGSRSISG